MKKQIQFLAVSALVLGLSACGGNDNPVPVNHNNQFPVGHQPNSGTFNNVNQQAIQYFQQQYGNITTDRSTVLGNQTLPQGTHSWQTVFDRLAQSARDCSYCQYGGYWGGYSHTGGLSNVDMNAFRDYLKMNIIDDTSVHYQNDPSFTYSMAHTVDMILSVMNQSYGYMSNYWGYGGYTPYYPYSDGLNVGVSFNNGNLSIGGSYSNW